MSSRLPFPELLNTVSLPFFSVNETLLLARAILCTKSLIYLNSVLSCFRNLYRTGVLKNKSSTIIVVPFGIATSSFSTIVPALFTTLYPTSSSLVLDSIVTFAIEAMLANASPLNPIEYIFSKSSTFRILLVACLSKAISISSRGIPFPLSVIFMNVLPPFFISIVTFVAFASIAFSTNSFTTFAGLSITSPAAI